MVQTPGLIFLGHVESKGLMYSTRPTDGSKQANRWFKSHKKLRFIALFLGGTANPEGGEAEAVARSAASAQASFPLAVPARRREQKRRIGRRGIKARQQEKADLRSSVQQKAKVGRKGGTTDRAGWGSLILGPPSAFFARSQRHRRKPAAFTVFLFLPAKSTGFPGLTCRAASRPASRVAEKKARGAIAPHLYLSG